MISVIMLHSSVTPKQTINLKLLNFIIYKLKIKKVYFLKNLSATEKQKLYPKQTQGLTGFIEK